MTIKSNDIDKRMEQLQADTLLTNQRYAEAATAYEQAIEHDPTKIKNYWYLGLALLLQGKEEEAQLIWMTPLIDAEPEQAAQWTTDLAHIIQAEADRQEANSAFDMAWVLRQHVYELMPHDIDNLLSILILGIKTQTFSFEDDLLPHIQEQLNEATSDQALPIDRLLQAIQALLNLNAEHPKTLAFIASCLPHFAESPQRFNLGEILLKQSKHCFQLSNNSLAIQLAKLCLKLIPSDLNVLTNVAFFMQFGSTEDLLESIDISKQILERNPLLTEKIKAVHSILNASMSVCRSWQETKPYYEQYKSLLKSVATLNLDSLLPTGTNNPPAAQEKLHELLAMGMFSFYFEDNPTTNRPIRNRVAEIAQKTWRSIRPDSVETYHKRASTHVHRSKPLRIGYLSSCLRIHSVGWLVRWLLEHHDRDRFDVHLYSTRRSDDPLQHSFIKLYGDHFHHLPNVAAEMVTQIAQDQIDILVDLDSLTGFDSCVVMALKPAPIQVSWLGCDAAGIPAIDYYIVDPYVVPSNAQSYYSETLWRMPHAYLAVDGFEIGVPDLRRDQLGIPNDAVVYLSSQTGLKRNPDNIRLQLQILKQVPNSYFLIKSFNAKQELLQEFFLQIAEEEGISGDRLRFLPDFPVNSTYRANLGLADVVLDTYPYNGATTTMEALWVGLPIVTRVGEQFAARNSYTMMMNVGVTEGIAWTDEDYIEWGVRLGKDAALRQKITYQLMRSRQTSPLWNGQQFARDMEYAYEQMWKIYQKF